MNPIELRENLKGPMAFAITPFRRQGNEIVVDTDSVYSNTKFLVDNGLKIIVPTGGTGEFYSLSITDFEQVVESTVAGAGNKAMVIPGIGPGYAHAMTMAKIAESAGCAGVMTMPPAMAATPDGYFEFYKRVAESVDIGVILYQAPNAPLSVETLIRIASIDNVVGFKDEIGDLNWFSKAVQAVGDKLVGICGLSEKMAPYYFLAGCKAYTSGASNILPKDSIELAEASLKKDFSKAYQISRRFDAIASLRARPGRHAPVVKAALMMMGVIKSDEVRLPLFKLNNEEKEELRGVLEGYGIQLHKG
jgi:dihydrodipicolinate synthase/N-acetylneuraminate lyase